MLGALQRASARAEMSGAAGGNLHRLLQKRRQPPGACFRDLVQLDQLRQDLPYGRKISPGPCCLGGLSSLHLSL